MLKEIMGEEDSEKKMTIIGVTEQTYSSTLGKRRETRAVRRWAI